jgi:hypothetical protein
LVLEEHIFVKNEIDDHNDRNFGALIDILFTTTKEHSLTKWFLIF